MVRVDVVYTVVVLYLVAEQVEMVIEMDAVKPACVDSVVVVEPELVADTAADCVANVVANVVADDGVADVVAVVAAVVADVVAEDKVEDVSIGNTTKCQLVMLIDDVNITHLKKMLSKTTAMEGWCLRCLKYHKQARSERCSKELPLALVQQGLACHQ